MNPPVINSTSAVSTTRRKREAERSVNWTAEETQVLLCAWSDERVQKSLAENLRNRHVFKHLSARMSEMGFARSPHQCRLRVKTLKASYVRAKLQRSVDSTQPLTFKYFAEMDAVLGRRSPGEDDGAPYFASPEHHPDSIVSRKAGIMQGLNSKTGSNGQHFGSYAWAGRQRLGSLEDRGGGRQAWELKSDIKLEDGEGSTDEFEYSSTDLSQRARDRHDIYLDSSIHSEVSGTLMENSLGTPSPRVVSPPPAPPPPPPPPPPLLIHSTGSILPAPHDANPSPSSTSPTSLEPVLKHLSECFQGLVSETRGLLVQLEAQRQEQARWHQELLAQWMQREERRQREAAEREERREKARMEHEIRVLTLLTGLAREKGCKCGGSSAAGDAPTGLTHSRSGDGE